MSKYILLMYKNKSKIKQLLCVIEWSCISNQQHSGYEFRYWSSGFIRHRDSWRCRQ